MSNHYQIETEQQPIELYKLLKIANLVSGGGEAKVAISEGYVLLNGEVETQKRKKIFNGDIIEFNGDLVELECKNEPTITVPRVKNTEKEQIKKPVKQSYSYAKKSPTGNSSNNNSSSKGKSNKTRSPVDKNKVNNNSSDGRRRSINLTNK